MTAPPLPPISEAEVAAWLADPELAKHRRARMPPALGSEGALVCAYCRHYWPCMTVRAARLLAAHRQLSAVAEAAADTRGTLEAFYQEQHPEQPVPRALWWRIHESVRRLDAALAGTAGRRVVAYVDEEGDTQRDRGDG